MEWIILIVSLLIFAETSVLLFRKVKPAHTAGKRKIYVDTSTLIDGRILEVARTGFMDGDLIILKTVLLELQLLADGKEPERRALGRMGLTNVSELERVLSVNTEIFDDTGGNKKVDEQLLKYAKENKAYILTQDYNLIKVAEAEDIKTLNINELAIAVRRDVQIGDKLHIHIKNKGSSKGQGVGYLPNGVMVVIENGASKIGKEVDVKISRYRESPSGRIVFAKIIK